MACARRKAPLAWIVLSAGLLYVWG